MYNYGELTGLVGVADNRDAAARRRNSPHKLILNGVRVLAVRHQCRVQDVGDDHSQLVYQHMLAPFPNTRVPLE